ncbi:M-phase phosphoprotein 6 [Lepeophtheirus salmonis]|uniref:M-phase phosphoprotein 6 n=1 Tax=Lepeophtheirus salmonis TaxID=72036 RepID=C1BSZ9_LEPSM|nr:M-phase phosphoprotein 6-like isoform X3 [Lepeophtheirus salmonis]ACO12152.1 M-phase phosphoprotein 6 [Lepeophtheirus salmonis]
MDGLKSRPQKKKLSRNLLQMKFMKKTKEKEDQAEEDAEGHTLFQRDITKTMEKQGSRFIVEPSFARIEDLIFGRLAYHGMNPAIEKKMANERALEEERIAEFAEKDINDEEMIAAMPSLAASIKRKFGNKRSHSKIEPKKPSSSEIHKFLSDSRALASEICSKKAKFLKPSEDV